MKPVIMSLVLLGAAAAPALAAESPAPALYEIDTEAQKAPPANSRLAHMLGSLHVRVCVRSDVPPLGYFNNGSLDGYDVELASEIVKQISVDYKQALKIEWAVVTAPERVKRLQENGCDLLVAALSHTAARAGQVEMSKVYLRTDKVLLAAAKAGNNPPVIAQIGGATGDIGGVKGTVRPFNTYQDVGYAMEAGAVDYIVTDRPIAEHLMRSTTKSYKIEKTLAKDAESYVVAAPKGDTALLQAINKALDDLARSGRVALLARRWL
jgi:polar amino acid transport system substrate-binding protein